MRIKLISELKQGDLFIWGSDVTRYNMCVGGEDNGPLICSKLEAPYPNDHVNVGGKVFWLPKSCVENSRWYLKTDIALVADYDNLDDFVHPNVMCQSCGGIFLYHNKFECKIGGYFVPLQRDLEALHPEYKLAIHGEDSDFFNSIGL